VAKLFDMARAPLKESLKPGNVGQEKPDPYSYEHRITLNSEDMSKLGVSEPHVGDVFHALGEAHVHTVEQQENQNGEKTHTVGLQLKKLALRSKQGTGTSLLGAVNKGLEDEQQDRSES
jgi:hypothetical protein